jgi:hypothetical protein
VCGAAAGSGVAPPAARRTRHPRRHTPLTFLVRALPRAREQKRAGRRAGGDAGRRAAAVRVPPVTVCSAATHAAAARWAVRTSWLSVGEPAVRIRSLPASAATPTSRCAVLTCAFLRCVRSPADDCLRARRRKRRALFALRAAQHALL